MSIATNPPKIILRIFFVAMILWLYFTPFSSTKVLIGFGVALAGSALFLAHNLRRSPAEWLIGWLARLVLILWSFMVLSPMTYSPIFLMVTLAAFKSLAVISLSSSRLRSIKDSLSFVAPVILMYASSAVAFIVDRDFQHNYDVLYYVQLLSTLFMVALAVEQILDKQLPRRFSVNNLKNSLFTFAAEYSQILPSASFIYLDKHSISGWHGTYLLIAIMLATFFPLDTSLSAESSHNLSGDLNDNQYVPFAQHTSMSIILEWSVWAFPLFVIFVGPRTSPVSQQIFAFGILLSMSVLVVRFRKLRLVLQGINLELTRMATFDKLTGILNRVGLNKEWERRREEKNTMLFIDLDRFKPINDQYGHLVGDEVLITTAKRIERTIRTTDVVSRVGGDEFVVVCSQLSEAQTQLLMKRIRDSIAQPIMLDASLRLQLDASIGYYHSNPTEAFADIINLADASMYLQKESRKTKKKPGQDVDFNSPEVEALCNALHINDVCNHLKTAHQPDEPAGGNDAQET